MTKGKVTDPFEADPMPDSDEGHWFPRYGPIFIP